MPEPPAEIIRSTTRQYTGFMGRIQALDLENRNRGGFGTLAVLNIQCAGIALGSRWRGCKDRA